MYSSSQPRLLHWYLYMAPLWLSIGSLSLGETRRFWWFCHPWSEFGCHIYHRSFWYFHKDLVCRVWQCDPYFALHGWQTGQNCCPHHWPVWLRLRSSDYKNHRIFSLRCIHKELIPVSIKLKSTLDTPKARQIIRKAEKDLLQARIKAINNILVQVKRETQDCRAKLASIISQERLEQCQHFINKVSELRFNKVKQRQINKLNQLVTKKGRKYN